MSSQTALSSVNRLFTQRQLRTWTTSRTGPPQTVEKSRALLSQARNTVSCNGAVQPEISPGLSRLPIYSPPTPPLPRASFMRAKSVPQPRDSCVTNDEETQQLHRAKPAQHSRLPEPNNVRDSEKWDVLLALPMDQVDTVATQKRLPIFGQAAASRRPEKGSGPLW